MKKTGIFLLTSAAFLASCQPDSGVSPSVEQADRPAGAMNDLLYDAATDLENWPTYGGDYTEQRFAPNTRITKENIQELGLAWSYDLSTARGVESTPVIVDGVMYVTGAWSIVYAVDARTGEELWFYDPEVSGEDAIKGCCDVVNRGVAYYDGKIYLGVFDGRLEALDAKTGELVWSEVTVDQSKPYTITMAPRIVKGRVIIGNSGGELGVRGYVSAYDAQTGALDWRFYTVPHPQKVADGAVSDEVLERLANDTWGDTGAWTTDGGGGTAWDSIIYDDVNNSIIVGVGNGSPWNAKIRDPEGNGDNLFLSSILALEADTGVYKWHFQTTPRDQWDYTATQSLILADLPLGDNNAPRRVVMQAPKNGFFYVLDAQSGDFISGDNFVPVNWATGLDATGRPIEDPKARITDEDPFLLMPGPLGAHNWHPMAFSPNTNLAYIPAQMIPQFMQDEVVPSDPDAYWNTGYNFSAGIPRDYPPGTLSQFRAANEGWLLAWDPVKQEAVWSVNHGQPWNGGVLVTASDIVFQGTITGEIVAYDAVDGEVLWSHDTEAGTLSGISTYELDGEQYVSTTTGWGTAWALAGGHTFESPVVPDVGRIVTFKLGGEATIPDPMLTAIDRKPKGDSFGTAEMLDSGLIHYSQNCMTCHGPFAISSGVLPDLRWSYITADRNEWMDVVMNGSLSEIGMVSFKEQLTAQQMEDIRAYVMQQAHLAIDNGEAG